MKEQDFKINPKYLEYYNKGGNIKLIVDDFTRMHGQHVINDSHKIERFIGVGATDEDYYYLTYDGRKINWHTCVGRLIQLKDKIDEKDYKYFIHIANLNHYDRLIINKEENGQQKLNDWVETYIKELPKDHDIIIGLDFELN